MSRTVRPSRRVRHHLFDGDYSPVGLTGLPIKESDGNCMERRRTAARVRKARLQNHSRWRRPRGSRVRIVRGVAADGVDGSAHGSFLVPGRDRILDWTPSGELTTVRHQTQAQSVLPVQSPPERPMATCTHHGFVDLSSAPERRPSRRVSRRARSGVVTPITGATSYTLKRIARATSEQWYSAGSWESFVDHTALAGQHTSTPDRDGTYGEANSSSFNGDCHRQQAAAPRRRRSAGPT